MNGLWPSVPGLGTLSILWFPLDFVMSWPLYSILLTISLLGLANFYAIVAQYSQLLFMATWISVCFDKPKEHFTSAPILKHPGSILTFLQFYASETTVGAIWVPRPSYTLLPFTLRKWAHQKGIMTLVTGNCWTIKWLWCYLLEETAHPILILTNHKNLEYLAVLDAMPD